MDGHTFFKVAAIVLIVVGILALTLIAATILKIVGIIPLYGV